MDGVIVDSHPIHGVETTQEGRPPQQFYEKRGISASHPDEALVFEDSVSRIGCWDELPRDHGWGPRKLPLQKGDTGQFQILFTLR